MHTAFLSGKVWHSTTLENLLLIIKSKKISCTPNNSNYHNGYCKKIGCVSLIDARELTKEQMEDTINWQYLLNQNDKNYAIFIEINSELYRNIINPKELNHRWIESESYKYRIIEKIEGGHVGDIPTSNLKYYILSEKLIARIILNTIDTTHLEV